MIEQKEEFLSTAELSALLKVTHQAVYKWRNEGLPHIQLGEKTFRYKASEVIEWLTNRSKKQKEGS